MTGGEGPGDIPVKALEFGTQLSKLLERMLGTETGKALDGLLGDELRFLRTKRTIRLLEKSEALAIKRGVVLGRIAHSVAVPLLEAASLAEEESMVDRWAALLAAAADPARTLAVPPSFPRILAELSPDDAGLLDRIVQRAIHTARHERSAGEPSDDAYMVRETDLSKTDVVPDDASWHKHLPIGLNNLERLALCVVARVGRTTMANIGVWPQTDNYRLRLTPLGQAFVLACMPPEPSTT